jgi:hypothetical protein
VTRVEVGLVSLLEAAFFKTGEASLKLVIALLVAASGALCFTPRASAITIQIDYSYDTNDFFNTQAKKDLLQDAANTLAARLTDNLSAITPGGNNTWSETFFSPATGNQVNVLNATVPANTVVIYAGGRDLGTQILGQGAMGGYSGASGDSVFNTAVSTRGQGVVVGANATDVGPWGGSITFTSNAQAGLSFSGAAPTNNTYDFFSIAIHELAHVLGFGTSDSWTRLAMGSAFLGPDAAAAHGGINVPLSSDRGHWLAGTLSNGRYAAMDSALYYNTRTGFTSLDFAGLADIGWTLAPLGIPGDVNHDGIVDGKDLSQVLGHWLTPSPLGDTNGDSSVNGIDLSTVLGHWQQSSGGGASMNVNAVPEPATIFSLAAGMLLLAATGRRAVQLRRSSTPPNRR